MKTHNHYFKTNIDFVHHNSAKSEKLSINFDDYPLGSMPREANSLRNTLLIQVANALSPSAFACSSNCWRKSSESRSWYCVDLFSFLIDIVITQPYYSVKCNYSIIAFAKMNKALIVLPTLEEPLITHLLKRSKSMTNYNSTPYTVIGASKSFQFNKINLLSNKDENISHTHKLLNSVILGYYAHAVAKSTAEPGNSNNLYLANKSTPFNRAIFVCSTRTPKERLETLRGSECPYELGMPKFGHTQFLSMVACNGKGSPFAVFQVSQFSSPLHATAQTLESLAVVPQNLYLELSAMIYLFKAVSRLDLRKTQKPFTSFPHYTLKVKADSVEQAQAKISRLFAVLSVSTMAEGVQYV